MGDLTYGGKGGQMAGVETPPQTSLPSPADLPQTPGMLGQLGQQIEQMLRNQYMQGHDINPQTMMQNNPLYQMPSQFAPKPVLGEQIMLRESDFDPATGQWMKAQPGSVPPGMGAQHNLEQSIRQRK